MCDSLTDAHKNQKFFYWLSLQETHSMNVWILAQFFSIVFPVNTTMLFTGQLCKYNFVGFVQQRFQMVWLEVQLYLQKENG